MTSHNPIAFAEKEFLKAYEKLLKKEGYDEFPIAPKTLELLAEFAANTYDDKGAFGFTIRDTEHAKHILKETHNARAIEGLFGFTLRDAEHVLKETFNARAMYGVREADPILLIETLKKFINNKGEENRIKFFGYVEDIEERYKKELQEQINNALIDLNDSACQSLFDKYILFAEKWLDNEDCIDPNSGERTDSEKIEKFLVGMERKAGIQVRNEEFRRDAVTAINREQANIIKRNAGKAPEDQQEIKLRWHIYEPVARLIRAPLKTAMESQRHILAVPSEEDLGTEEEKRLYNNFQSNMRKDGLTNTMIARALFHLNLGPSVRYDDYKPHANPVYAQKSLDM